MDTISTPDGDFAAYIARPEGDGKFPAMVILQEIFGVNANVKGIADQYAACGYLALAPDLFWRLEPNVSLDPDNESERAKAFDLMSRFDAQASIKDIQSAIAALRADPQCNGRVGAVGFCLGGQLAYLTALHTDIKAAIGYYGVGIQDMLPTAETPLETPLMLHIAREDEFVPQPAQAAIHAALDDHPQATLHDYAGCDHAFAREGGMHYDGEAAATAHARSLDFLRAALA